MTGAESCTSWMFHYVGNEARGKFPHLKGASVAEFSEFLDWASSRGGVVTPDTFLGAVSGDRPLPSDSHLLTFDDGLGDHYRCVFPELKRRGLSALFFVTTKSLTDDKLLRVHRIHALYGARGYDWLRTRFAVSAAAVLGRRSGLPFDDPRAKTAYPYDDGVTAGFKYAINYLLPAPDVDAVLDHIIDDWFDEGELAREFYMSPGELQEMSAAGMQFGFHGHTHQPFSRLTLPELAAEMDESAATLGALLPELPVCASYPYGDASSVTDYHIALLRQRGIRAAFMAEESAGRDDALRLPRVDIAQWQRGSVS